MPWYAHVWLVIPWLIGAALLVVLGLVLGWGVFVFALVLGGVIFFGSRTWARRRFGRHPWHWRSGGFAPHRPGWVGMRWAISAFAGVALASLMTACSVSSIDPTEGTFYVKLLNDTNRTVIVSDCSDDDGLCVKHQYDPEPLKPGQEFPTVETYINAINVELISTRGGRRLGCVPMYFDYKASGYVVRVSEAVPCAKNYPVRHKTTA